MTHALAALRLRRKFPKAIVDAIMHYRADDPDSPDAGYLGSLDDHFLSVVSDDFFVRLAEAALTPLPYPNELRACPQLVALRRSGDAEIVLQYVISFLTEYSLAEPEEVEMLYAVRRFIEWSRQPPDPKHWAEQSTCENRNDDDIPF